MSLSNQANKLLEALINCVGKSRVLTLPSQQQAYVVGIVSSSHKPQVSAVVVPDKLLTMWHVLTICASFDAIIIAQAANTSLTGGSTPFGEYDRPVVVLSMQDLGGVHLIDDAQELVALPAASLQQLEALLAPLGREPHSVLGSSCVGASVIGGICNNSGGMLVQRGPAYTEMALFARRNEAGQFELINHLGIELGDTPEQILPRLEQGDFAPKDIQQPSSRSCTNHHYQHKVRDCAAATPARHNNDPSGLFEASGSAGKVIVFAVRVATFAKAAKECTFYLSSNDAAMLTRLRREWLSSELGLPVFAEYMHRRYNEVTLRYGRDTCLSMRKLPAARIGDLYRLQAKMAYYLDKWHLPKTLPNRVLQGLSVLMPAALSSRLAEQALAFEYHLLIKVTDDDIDPARDFLQRYIKASVSQFTQCHPKESEQLLIFRSAATAAMFRYHNLNANAFGELISTDIALPRNAEDWDEVLPPNLQQDIKETFYLGHFFCHVMHQDYLLMPMADNNKVKDELLAFYDQRGVAYPAEHNVGHTYKAKPTLSSFYKKLDPTNSLNPGIGRSAKWKNWRSSPLLMEESND